MKGGPIDLKVTGSIAKMAMHSLMEEYRKVIAINDVHIYILK